MADEPTTDVTNSEAAAIQTDAPAATDTTTSPTDKTTPDQQHDEADPLDVDSLVKGTSGDAPADEADEGEDDGSDGGADGEPAELHGAPEDDYELTLPEGMTLDADALTAITPLAKELNLSNAGLTKLANEGLPVVEAMVNRAMVQDVVATRKAWADDSRAYVQGGKLADGTEIAASDVFKGENMDAVTATAGRAIDRFTTDAAGQPLTFPNAKPDGSPGTFNDFLKTTGLGLHPALVHAFYVAGQAISEDSDFERHGDVPQTKLTRAQKYYGDRA